MGKSNSLALFKVHKVPFQTRYVCYYIGITSKREMKSLPEVENSNCKSIVSPLKKKVIETLFALYFIDHFLGGYYSI